MSKDSGLPTSYRQILGLIRNAARWLDELETLCFVQAERISVSRAA